MKRILIYLVISIIIALGLLAMASDDNVSNIDHQIMITTKDDFLSVTEIFKILDDSNESYETIAVWIQSDAKNVEILVNSYAPDSIIQNGSEYICNISSLGIKKCDSPQLKISYELSKNGEFIKKIIRPTNSISITFNQDEIFTGTNLAIETSINLQLYKPSEQTLDWYITVSIILLVILLVVLVTYTFRKQKSVKIKEIVGASKELLTTKKILLMSILKDIEKQHRAKQISDDTYHKLKEQYKQDAVEAMKQLEDMK